ncbi:MAG: T9SS type A sorting domain-containing protein [Bacteroidota bacterium]
MKKNYFLLLCFSPFMLFAQIVDFTSTITPDLSAYGEATNYTGEGEYQIFLGNDNVLDKPIIVVDGFDPGDERSIAGLYSLLSFTGTSGAQNLADLVRAEDFDVVILNFPQYTRLADNADIDGGADFIERNAMLLVDLIQIINTAKAPNSPEENVIIGPSMGGLISRYALNYMEANTLDHDTRLWISFDSPHHGANVPIGLQHQLNYLAFNALNPVTDIQPLINGFLNSPAARQLLVDHFEPHLLGGSTVEFDPSKTLPEAHPFRAIFETNINSFNSSGFPENVRKVSIMNGSGIGASYFAIGNSGTTVSPGFEVMNSSFQVPAPPFGNVDIDIVINFTPTMNTTANVSTIVIDPPIFAPTTETANSQAFPLVDGVDAAPGGLFDLSALTGDVGTGDPLAADFLNALQIDKFNFIPTVSALALEITDSTPIDWYHNINLSGRATTNNTPFDNTFLPDANEGHVELTQDNVDFALLEILTPQLSTDDFDAVSLKLERNPIDERIVLLSDDAINSKVQILDLTGKVVYNEAHQLNNRTEITVNLASGIYILNVTSETNSSFITKFVVQ